MLLIRKAALIAAALPLLFAATPALACASCGCTFTADWLSQGLVTQPGSALTIRSEYVPQTELRSGTDPVDRAAIALPTTREIEQRTDNYYATLAFDHQFASDWGLNVSVPFIARPHDTIAAGDTDISHSSASGIGDLRVSARWQGLSGHGSVTGLQFGLVLPTGGFHHNFLSGPQAGQGLDRGLQPGAGALQAIIGAYHYRRLSPQLALVAQAQLQTALATREDYRPGTLGEASLALQWLGFKAVTPSLQLNLRVNARDSGLQADAGNSGGEALMIAPGLSARLSDHISAFGLVQLPLYRRYNGYQLAPKAVLSGGLQYRF